ncbi:hypothetical protein CPC08DRAFT_739993 [Agrocybe pediades]|nr:hypothetical protein CPC08DRAFT_739993 [Agrocybe pediades]
MEWHDSDPSDEEHAHQEDTQTTSRKRSSRACDQCRKTKSKCERSSGDSKMCKSCALTGTPCTYLGPSYKRGPPKGYIHAIEQRWHQVEALLGAILQCPDQRVQSVVSDLRQDDLAREILGRVDSGPYGPSGRRNQRADATKEDFFASILKSNESAADLSRARRQSRVSREIVSSNQDHGLAVVPTKEWQDNLSKRLAFGSSTGSSSRLSDDSGAPVSRRRRLNDNLDPPNWNSLYTIDPTPEDVDDIKGTTEELGQLSLDENQEVRYHGQASGLHLLGRSERTDDRIDGGIWRLPMARVWPASKFGIQNSFPPGPTYVDLPPQNVQDRLIELYFTYIHPVFPVVHKTRFLAEFNARKQNDGNDFRDSPHLSSGSAYSSPRPEPTQEVTRLLLFSMFAVAARFTDEDQAELPDGKMWDAGCDYLDRARDILTKIFHISRPSTVQSLMLLGYREFGIGSMEQGWIFIGMGIRMAYDLGLNCDSSNWKMHGHDLFSAEETQTRRQIWWVCVQTDRYGSFYMGRPIMIKDGDFDTPLPNVDPMEDRQPWQPLVTRNNISYPPVPGRTMSVFCATSRLAVITGAIVTQIYPVQVTTNVPRSTMLADLESRLDQWLITLPEELRFEGSTKKLTPPPQIIYLHLRYWGAVLLLHRAFIPNWKGKSEPPRRSTLGTRAFDLAHGAACHISTLMTQYRDTFTMRRASPFVTSYLLAASIMHILTLTLRPDNIEATVALQNCMSALKEMGTVWPSASRAWELVSGVHLRANAQTTPQPPPQQYQYVDRNKRGARDAFGEDKSADYLRRDQYRSPGAPDYGPPVNTNVGNTNNNSNFTDVNGVQDISTRLMAHMLGLEIPGAEPSTSYFPGYEWWPRMSQNMPPPGDNQGYAGNTADFSDMQAMNSGGNGATNWEQNLPTPVITGEYGLGNNNSSNSNLNYTYDFGQYGM